MTGKHATGTYAALTRRTLVAAGTTGALAGLCAPFIRPARAAPTVIRYATGGGIGPNEMETVIYLDWMQKNVLKGYGPCNQERLAARRRAHEEGRWVREAALAHAAKQKLRASQKAA